MNSSNILGIATALCTFVISSLSASTALGDGSSQFFSSEASVSSRSVGQIFSGFKTTTNTNNINAGLIILNESGQQVSSADFPSNLNGTSLSRSALRNAQDIARNTNAGLTIGQSKSHTIGAVIGTGSPDAVIGTGSPNAVIGTGAPNAVIGTGSPNAVIGTGSPNAVIGTGSPNAVIGTGAARMGTNFGANAVIGTGYSGNAVIGTGQSFDAVIGTGQSFEAVIGTGFE